MIKSFADTATEKVFNGVTLSKKERKAYGALRVTKAFQRLHLLNASNESDLLASTALHYHSLHNGRHSIDADARNSPWRITFTWENEEMNNVKLVKIEDTH